MAELRGRGINYTRNGRRVFATPNNFEAERQTQEWEARPRAWKARVPIEEETRESTGEDVQIKSSNESKLQNSVHDAVEIRTVSSKQAVREGSQGFQDQKEGNEDDVSKAAALLLEKASSTLFGDLCDLCSASLKLRLTSIASGSSATDWSHGASESPNEDPKSVCSECQNFEERDRKLEVIPRQERNSERMANATAYSNGATASNIIKSALRSIRDAPAYRTRSMSRHAGLLQTPDQVSTEFASENREQQHILEVRRKKDFYFLDRVNGQNVNILEGLELHTNVFNKAEQKELIDFVYELQELGRNQKLRRRTYSEPRKWMRGKGRVTIQFGCCYNYAVDKDGKPPGIIREEEVDEIPRKFRMVIKRLVEWHVLPPSCIPDSCIVNIYDVGDCIPPHIDHHDFVRPFCTLSLLSECNIIFGTNLKIAGPGEFLGSFTIPLPTGSVLILNGNGADIAKHAVPAVPTQRISITFRKMEPTKVPVSFRADEQLLSTRPLPNAGNTKLTTLNSSSISVDASHSQSSTSYASQFSLESDFPVLGNSAPGRPAPDGRLRSLRV